MIFGELTTEERSALGTSCKRFRKIDFKLGKKLFGYLSIKWVCALVCAIGLKMKKKAFFDEEDSESCFISMGIIIEHTLTIR